MIDYSSRRLQVMERFGFKHYFGDATRPDLLAAAGIGEAKLFVVAIDDRDQISELVKYVCATYPDLPVVARAPTATMSTTSGPMAAATSSARPMTARCAWAAPRWRNWAWSATPRRRS
jgi:Trk K+ transport system NAD-binding subunit